MSWKELAGAKLQARDARILHYLKSRASLPDLEPLVITSTASLLKDLSSGRYSSLRVILHFIEAAITAHDKTNCITEPLFEQAIERAEYLDSYLAAHAKPIGPLHGLPISLKDQFDVKGIDSTLGWSSLINKPAQRDCLLVQLLLKAGAVPFVKTNLPQTIMFAETDNPVFGPTHHPLKRGFSPGGSSGGEAALIASNASLLGWGTDLGGSIRMPCHLCGLFGLKPSHGRLPYLDVSVTQFGNETVPSVVGPIAQDLDTLLLAVKTVIDGEPWRYDPKCLPLPWRTVSVLEKMRIGVLWDDGIVEPLPPTFRALFSTTTKLKSAGHEIIDWTPDYHQDIIDICDALFVIDKGADFKQFLMPGEPLMPRVEKMMDRGALATVTGSVHDLWALQQRKQRLQKQYLDKMEQTGIDFLLTPVMATTAAPLGKHCWHVGYTKFVNLLDLTAAVFPVTTVARSDTKGLGREARNDFEKAAWREWDPVEQEGMPVGLQLIGKRLEEEKVLMGVQQIVAILQG